MADRPASGPLLVPLAGALAAVADTLDTSRTPGMVIGGVAASILGRPRATRDVDAVAWVAEEAWPAFLAAAAAAGLEARVADPLAFARTSRVLLLRHAASGVDVDISLGSLPFEQEAIRRARRTVVAGIPVPLATAEDLVILKAVANRPRDHADIAAIVDATPKLDRRRVRKWVRAFAGALDAPELLEALERLLRRAGPRRRR